MDILLLSLSILLLIISVIGCIVPAIPGPILAYGALWIYYATDFSTLSGNYMAFTGAITLVVFLADYFLPPLITKQFGGTQKAAWGSIIGMLIGMIIPPIGIILGMLLGAFIGELFFANSSGKQAILSTIGTFLGFVVGTGLKLALCFYFAYVIIAEVIGLIFQ